MFIKKYLSAWEVIKDEKGGHALSKDYNQFAIRLQEVEALMMFDTVNVCLLKRGIKCYNNFDSLYVNNMGDYETAKQLTIDAFNAIDISPKINSEFYNTETSDSVVSRHQISDQYLEEHKGQASEPKEEIDDLKQLLQAGIKQEFLAPFDNSHDSYGYLEGFLYLGNKVQTRKYFSESYKLSEEEVEVFYNDQFRLIESMVV